MPAPLTRRDLLATASIGLTAAVATPSRVLAAAATQDEPDPSPGALAAFPAQAPVLVREIVGASHRSLDRVKELLRDFPSLAVATWDWGFGDFETALGAASHVGNRPIARALIEHGARPDLFTHAMLGHLEVVRATISAAPGIERIRGPHGLTLLHHAKAGGTESAAVADYLATLPGADVPYTDIPLSDEQKRGYTGIYRFGAGSSDLLEIFQSKPGAPLSVRRVEGLPARLFHQGDHVFHPAGAPETKFAFDVRDGRAARVAITCPAHLCEAVRGE